jgi:[acyl-carrier-protein] S-malonyltransferase
VTAPTTTPDAANRSGTATTPAVAAVFPGQGSQRAQMARPWADHPASALWGQADKVLGRNVTRLGLDADTDELRAPSNCQVALFVHHAVLWSAWRDAGGTAAVTAGHSLGEYNALLAAGVLDFAAALRLVDARARATQAAAQRTPGGMVACLGGDEAAITDLCAKTGVHLANDNATGQVVVAGTDAALDLFMARAAELRARPVRLEVGAAYHSPLMASAVAGLDAALATTTFADAQVPVVANVDGQVHTAATEWPELLRAQLLAPVRWRETVRGLAQLGVEEVVELGASPVLSGLVKRTDPALRRRHVSGPDDLVVSL